MTDMNTNKQNDTSTYAVKLDVDVKEELQQLIKDYKDEGTQGDLMRLLIETFKNSQLTNTVVDAQGDLRELTKLTTRIYNLYNNLIERNETNIDNVKINATEQLRVKEDIICEMKEQIQELKDGKQLQQEELQQLEQINKELEEALEQLRDRTSKDNKLIDKLELEVQEIVQLKSDNSTLLKEVNQLELSVADAVNLNKELQSIVGSKEVEVSGMAKQLEAENMKHKEELEQVQDKLELQHQQTILKLQQDHQKEIQEVQEQRIKDIDKQQDKYIKQIDKASKDKEQLQEQVEELQERLNKVISINNTKTNNKTGKPVDK